MVLPDPGRLGAEPYSAVMLVRGTIESLSEDLAGLINNFIVHDSVSCGDLHVSYTVGGGGCWKRPRKEPLW